MSMKCPECDGELIQRVLSEYEDDLIIIGRSVCLVNSVLEERCASCEHVQRTIPDLDGLLAAAAVSRALHRLKLRGEELRFMRKVLQISSRELADVVGVTPETMSRWENNRDPITATSEKLLRFIVAGMLRDKAPFIEFDMKDIAEMRLVPVYPDQEGPSLRFERTAMRFMQHDRRLAAHWSRFQDAA